MILSFPGSTNRSIRAANRRMLYMNTDSRLSLQPVRDHDAPSLIAANIASQSYHRPWVHPCTDQPGFESWLARTQSGTELSFLARLAATGAIAGVINLSQIFKGNFCSAYLGFYGMAEFAGQGLMTEALSLTAQYAFGPLGLHRLEANIQPDNTRSLALVQRAGFRREGYSPKYLRIEGIWRDHERWALLAPED